ncbi:MAG: hypothetical protein M1826_002818 [Phylliscum demangeonii]|nr:MAG: hypothetical protein M1826_002818 [Phylliscum demangeonii]
MEACWSLGGVNTVGGRPVGYEVAQFCATSTPVSYADSISARPNDLHHNHGCLGLRLRMTGGESVITTTTHAFGKLVSPHQSWLRRRVADWIVRAVESLAGPRGLMIQAAPPAVVEARAASGGTNSPVGTVVWLAGTDRKARVTLPPASLRSYAAALDGGPLFVCRLECMSGCCKKLEGRGMLRAAQEAVALGCEHTWNRRALSQQASLLWRTNYDRELAMGFSGSVRCLGRVADGTARAIGFQNYKSPLMATQVTHDVRDAIQRRATFRAGILVPPDVRLATIEVGTNFESQPLPHPLPAYKRASAGRRAINGTDNSKRDHHHGGDSSAGSNGGRTGYEVGTERKKDDRTMLQRNKDR